MFNVLGEAIDLKGAFVPDDFRVVSPFTEKHRRLISWSSNFEILETGIKVIDLLAPYLKGGKIGLFGGAGVERRS